MRVELQGDETVESSAIGVPSPGLGMTFAMVGHHLAVCCPAGRMVRPGDDPFGWLVEADRRADVAELRADTAETRADAAEARVAELLAKLERLGSSEL